MQDIDTVNQPLFKHIEFRALAESTKKSVKISIMTSSILIVTLNLVWVLGVFAKPPFDDMNDWQKTDFARSSVQFEDVVEGGPGKDGIQSIDEPKFDSIADAKNWLDGREPVVAFTHDGESRAYPLQILMYHELVNDNVAEQPISVTYCPLCNAAMVFERQYKGHVLEFGISGKVYNSNMVMYDRQTESWWLQFTGEGVVGKYMGATLNLLPSQLVSFAQFQQAYPNGTVLSRNTGFNKKYGVNPYANYDSRYLPIAWFYRKPFDDRLPAMKRVLGVALKQEAIAFPLFDLKKTPLLQTDISNQAVLIISKSGMASAVDKKLIKNSKDVLAAAAFSRVVKGRQLDFKLVGGKIIDEQTMSAWNMFGQSVEGEFKGTKLKQVDRGVYFSFVWLEFYPESFIFEQIGD